MLPTLKQEFLLRTLYLITHLLLRWYPVYVKQVVSFIVAQPLILMLTVLAVVQALCLITWVEVFSSFLLLQIIDRPLSLEDEG